MFARRLSLNDVDPNGNVNPGAFRLETGRMPREISMTKWESWMHDLEAAVRYCKPHHKPPQYRGLCTITHEDLIDCVDEDGQQPPLVWQKTDEDDAEFGSEHHNMTPLNRASGKLLAARAPVVLPPRYDLSIPNTDD